MTPGVDPKSVLNLYKKLFRYSKSLTFTDKDYYIKFIRKEFQKHRHLEDPAEIQFQYQGSSFCHSEDLSRKYLYDILKMLRKWHLLRQPFAIAPIHTSATASNRYIQATNRACILQQSLYPPSQSVINFRNKGTSSRNYLDKSRIPVLNEEDLEEQFIKGSGPGGSNVNKRTNCCHLKHVPSGLQIKCHLSRLLEDNRKLARLMMVEKLDELYNGEMSIKAQKARFLAHKSENAEQKTKKNLERKKKYKELLCTEDETV